MRGSAGNPVAPVSPRLRVVLRGLVLSVAAVSLCMPAWGQSVSGRILGLVTDQTGGSVAGATVTVTDVQRGSSRTMVTDESGQYVAPQLPPGLYSVRVEAKGFKTAERTNIQLEVAKDVTVDVSLEPGELNQTVIVTEQVPLIDTTSSTLGGTLSNQQINDLPLNGRNYENLLQLRPAVVRYPGGGFSTTSTNGLRAEDNVYLFEGLLNSEPYSGQNIVNGAGIAGDSATILPVDAIQEFNVMQNPPAQYGWKPGTIVNVGLKAGTNSLHGTAYAFGRDTAFDARNFFDPPPNPKTPAELQQWGVTVGGPIKKDKIFFFAGYEAQTYHVGNNFGGVTSPITVPNGPLGTDPVNNIPDAVHALLGADVPISAASLKIAGCSVTGTYPNETTSCNGSGFPTNPGPTIGIFNGFPNDVTVRNVIGKVDYHVNDRHSVNGYYFFGNNSGIVEDFMELQSNWRSFIHTRAQVAGGSWVWVPSSRWVNEVRVGYNRLYQPTKNADLNVNPATAYGLNTGVPFGPLTGGLPRISFIGYFTGLGGFKWPKIQGPDSITQFIDHVSYNRGIHALKFGGEVHHNSVNGGAFGNARGNFKFVGGNTPQIGGPGSSILEDFLAGNPVAGSVQVGDPQRHLTNWGYAFFGQDDIRVARNLTVNLGLRYELNTVVKEEHNLIGNFDPNLGLVQVGKQIGAPYQGNHANFAPRVGFAWDPKGTGKFVVRGGGGLLYEFVNWQTFIAFNNSLGIGNVPTGFQGVGVPPGEGTILAGNLAPNLVVPWDTTPTNPIFGDLSPANLACGDGVTTATQPCPILGIDHNLTTPYVAIWTLNAQYAFTPNLSLEVAYVGNHGSNLVGIRDINQPPVGTGWTAAAKTACLASAPAYSNCAVDGVAEQQNRPFTAPCAPPVGLSTPGNCFGFLSNIFQMGNFYRSNYNGLQATFTARNWHGLGAIAGYTYSHALDDVGANWDFGYGLGLPMDARNPGREYASSDFDMRHRFTLSLTYMLPGKKSFAQLLEGWQLTSIITLDSAQPWGAIDLGSDVSGTGPIPGLTPPGNSPNRWDFIGSRSDFKSGPTPIPYVNYATGQDSPACDKQALALDGGTPGLATAALHLFGCFAKANSIMIPPPLGTFGTMGRNIFPDSGFRNWDFSIGKNMKFGERLSAQFRAEFFNILNHPSFANPYGGQNGYGQNDPVFAAGTFGCGCATPDVAAANPVVGSGGARAIQLGLKFLF